jgi:hypothetical protein
MKKLSIFLKGIIILMIFTMSYLVYGIVVDYQDSQPDSETSKKMRKIEQMFEQAEVKPLGDFTHEDVQIIEPTEKGEWQTQDDETSVPSPYI